MHAEIKLTRGKVALVDLEDYERLNRFSWLVWEDRATGRLYAGRWSRKQDQNGRGKFMIPMHGEVLEKIDGLRIDHIQSEATLDNRKSNLRRATASQNAANAGTPRNNTSGFKGVCWSNRQGKWRAYIRLNRKQIHLGFFTHKEAAAKAYDTAALKAFGEFSRLNLPPDSANIVAVPQYGYCQCGCGRKTTICSHTKITQGYKKGFPYNFLPGHRPSYSTLDEKILAAQEHAA